MSAFPFGVRGGPGVCWSPTDGARGMPLSEPGGQPTDGARGSSEFTDDQLANMEARQLVGELNVSDAEFNPAEDLKKLKMPGPIAEAFYWSNAGIVCIRGPVGSGKTTTLMRSRLRRAREMPPSCIDGVRRYTVLFVRETYRQLWSSSIPSYLETFPKSWGDWAGGRGDPVTHKIIFDDGFGLIEFTALFMAFGDDPMASLRGIQVTDMVLNEADQLPDTILTVGVGRIDRAPAREHFADLPIELRTYGQIACDQNAPDEDNWTFEVFDDDEKRETLAAELSRELPKGAPPIRIEFYNQPGYGEPGTENTQNLSANYYPLQIAAQKLAGRSDILKRMVYNKVTFLREGDPVFLEEFNRRIHVAQETLEVRDDLPLIIGLDQGLKGAALILQCDESYTSPRWRALAELHFPKKRLLAKQFGRELRNLLERPRFGHIRFKEAYGDMAGEQGSSLAADENETWNLIVSREAGITVRPQKIGSNRIQPRLEAVRAALEAPIIAGQPGLLIDPCCKLYIRGFESRYVWKEEVDKSGDKRKVPDKSKAEANVHDAGQYGLLKKVRGDGTTEHPHQNSQPGSRRRRPPEPAKQGLQTAYDPSEI